MYYLVYKITNKANGKIYIGAHRTDRLDDGYMGSGKAIKSAIEKYGLQSFEREILFEATTAEEMFDHEAKLVTREFVSRDDTYNLQPGGSGYFCFPMDEQRRSEISRGAFLGKSHSVDARIKMSKAKSYDGTNNPQFGKKWAHNPKNGEHRLCTKELFEELLKDGWLKGPGKRFNSDGTTDPNKVRIINPVSRKTTVVHQDLLEQYLIEGWVIGKNSVATHKWMTKDGTCTRVHESEVMTYLKQGWSLGRK